MKPRTLSEFVRAPKETRERIGSAVVDKAIERQLSATPEPRRGTWADFVEHAGGGATYVIYVDGVEHTRGYRTSLADARKDAREDLQIARMFCGRAGKREE